MRLFLHNYVKCDERKEKHVLILLIFFCERLPNITRPIGHFIVRANDLGYGTKSTTTRGMLLHVPTLGAETGLPPSCKDVGMGIIQ